MGKRARGEMGSATILLDGTVHVVTWMMEGGMRTLCGTRIDPYAARKKILEDVPTDCMACVAELR